MENENQQGQQKPSGKMKYIIGLIILIGLGYGIKTVMYNLHHETTDNAMIEGHEYPVIGRVTGYVTAVNVNDYDAVKPAQTILQFDNKEYKIGVTAAQGDLDLSIATLAEAKANKKAAEAKLHLVKATAKASKIANDKAADDLNRAKNLFKDHATTQKTLDDATAQYNLMHQKYAVAQDQITLAKQSINIAASAIKKAEAAVDIRKAKLKQAELNLSYTTVKAPVEGRIGKMTIEPGQFVAAGQPLFTVVNDQNFYVVANMKETQLENIKVGDEAEVSVDAYPDLELSGKVDRISRATGAKFSLLPPDNATGNFVKIVQRVPVIIKLNKSAKAAKLLRSGLSVDVSVAY
ncbi:HlyD family secretion protein [Persicobacter psychrovividus]